jgi:hypothetical protein
MPLVIAGFISFRRKYVLGVTNHVWTALEINANHFQMTYYLLIFLLILSVILFIVILKIKTKPLLNSLAVLAIAGIFAIGANATNLLATAEYASFRGKRVKFQSGWFKSTLQAR